MRKHLFLGLGLVAGLATLVAGAALAQAVAGPPSPDAWFDLVCSNHGAFFKYAAIYLGGATLLANARRLLPAWAVPLVDLAAGNLFTVVKSLQKPALPVLVAALLGLGLAACTGNPAADAVTVEGDAVTLIGALCNDAAASAKQFPLNPVSVYADAACPAGIAAAGLVQNSDTAKWLGDIVAQIKAAKQPAAVPAAPAAPPKAALLGLLALVLRA